MSDTHDTHASVTATSPPSRWPLRLAALAGLAALGSLFAAHLSGCTADLKAGTWGDFEKAVQAGGIGLVLDLFAVACVGTSLAMRPGRLGGARITLVFAAGLLTIFVLQIAGVLVQLSAYSSCA